MKLFIKAKAGARENKIEPLAAPDGRPNEKHYAAAVVEPPVKGRANQAIATLLAQHFGVSRSQVYIVSGATSRHKIFEVEL